MRGSSTRVTLVPTRRSIRSAPSARPRASRRRRSTGSPCSGTGSPTARRGSRRRSGGPVAPAPVRSFRNAQRRHQEAGGAEAALEADRLEEPALHGVHPVDALAGVVSEPFDRRDFSITRLDGQDETRPHGFAVEQHRAGAAHAVLAAEMRAREAELLAEELGERAARLDGRAARRTVHDDVDGHPIGHVLASPLLPAGRGSVAQHPAREEAGDVAAVRRGRVQVVRRDRAPPAPLRPPPRSRPARRVRRRGAPRPRGARTGVGATPVNASARPRIVPSSASPTTAPAPTSAKSP